MTIDDIVAEAAQHSDIHAEVLTRYAKHFGRAHERAPDGPSLEIGTRAGGSALLWLRLLQSLYARPPMLFTVDPYGDKRYDWQPGHHYTDEHYVAAKQLLAPFANHAHFLLRSEEFLRFMIGVPYWRDGVRQRIAGFSFAFLDGDHSKGVIQHELDSLKPVMRSGGVILVDNADAFGSPELVIECP